MQRSGFALASTSTSKNMLTPVVQYLNQYASAAAGSRAAENIS